MNHFVVEAGRAAAGIAVRVPGGYRFFYSDPRFRSLDGKIFRRARTLARKVGELAGRRRPGDAKEASGNLTVH
jgi:hypothetical protein